MLYVMCAVLYRGTEGGGAKGGGRDGLDWTLVQAMDRGMDESLHSNAKVDVWLKVLYREMESLRKVLRFHIVKAFSSRQLLSTGDLDQKPFVQTWGLK